MTLADVPDFVSDHAGQFTFALRGDDQSGVHGDKAAGNRKGIEGMVNERIEKEIVCVRIRDTDKLIAQSIEVLERFRVIEIAGIASNLAHHPLAQGLLFRWREFRARHCPHAGQVEVKRLRRQLLGGKNSGRRRDGKVGT